MKQKTEPEMKMMRTDDMQEILFFVSFVYSLR